jgi:hypothetical protein
LGDELFVAEASEILEVLDSGNNLLPAFGRTHPSIFAGPRGVGESSGALFERECFMCPVDDEVFFLRWLIRGLAKSMPVPEGTKAKEDRDSLCESCSNVFIASIRDALDRLRRA